MENKNELIAEFMGVNYYKDEALMKVFLDEESILFYCEWHPEYHKETNRLAWSFNPDKNWCQLMPVVEKIEKLYRQDFPPDFIARMLAQEPTIDHHYMDVIAIPLGTPINEVHAAIIAFIEWYNANKPTN